MRRRPNPGLLAAALFLAACQGGDRGGEPDAQASAEVASLQREVAVQREIRAALEVQLAAQRDRIEELTAEAEAPPPGAGAPAPEASGAGEAEPGVEGTDPAADGSPAAERRPWFDANALRVRDIPPHDVARIQEHFGDAQMAQIELQHQAMREGWHKTSRYRDARRQIGADFRAEIGDEDYDLLLYGSGKHNRVVVADVVDRSPGYRSGFRAGDVIVRYDDLRIFGAPEIQRASTTGKLGETVPVEVLRDGEIVRLYIDRGPMGFGLEHRRMWPHHLR